MTAPPRVGLVGCGRWGANILRDLVALGCVVHVADIEAEPRAKALAAGAASAGPALADDTVLDGIVIATPTTRHVAAIDESARFGTPIFVEKPLAPDVHDARRVALELGDRLFVMDKWRYHPGVAALREIAASGRLGRVQGVRCERVQWGQPHTDVDGAWILLPHDLSIGIELLGGPLRPIAAVASTTGEVVHDLSGTLVDRHGRWLQVHASTRSPRIERRVEVHGDAAVAVLAGGRDDMITIHDGHPGERMEVQVSAEGELPLLAELRCFVAHLAGGPPPKSSAAEAVAVVEAVSELRRLAGAR